MSRTVIRTVEPHSPAARGGLQAGETLLAVNGHTLIDVLDYKFYSYDPKLTLTVKNSENQQRSVQILKRAGQDLGLEFETYLMDGARSCANNCIFCFVDQMPQGMRKTLYFKDDDARLSFLMGNYITLTNLSDREVQRIIDLRVSPINISVHTTNRDLRVEMLGQKHAGRGIDIMERLSEAGITMNCQIVACPGVNDGAELDRTMTDLLRMYPAVNSVSIVPVGITKFRENLYPLRPYTKEEASALTLQVENFAKTAKEQTGTSLIFCSDEFYLLAERELPPEDYFEDFTQLDNGVGMLTLFRQEFCRGLRLLDEEELSQTTPFSVATGKSASPMIADLISLAKNRCNQVDGNVYTIQNDFFGETITVAGLITGQDLIAQLEGKNLGERLLISKNMLRSGEQVFLDDVTLQQVSEALGVPVIPVGQDGYELCDAVFNQEMLPAEVHEALPEAEYYRYN